MDFASQTGIHDGEVLVRQSEVDDKLRLIAIEESLQLLNVVGIHLSSLNIHLVALGMDVLNQLIAFFLAAASNHKLGENVLVLDDLEGSHGSTSLTVTAADGTSQTVVVTVRKSAGNNGWM